MAIIKCKMCGGDLTLIEGQSVAECEYCGSRQTVPAADNEKKLTLFARANRLRAACEFDKAAGIYESIVTDFPEEAEAYWGLVLCKYGIEYVDDPVTGKKIPTCHRSSFDSVMEDGDFEQAVENADVVARKVYREEAKSIEEIRKGILEVSAKEPPYDVFICYKETAEDGNRTIDSVIAQDVYDALTEKGYRVFFSRITLEDKLGNEYEPYILAALNSAKVMLVFGTNYEHFNAVWVKNEWSRFLSLIATGHKKTLIPCYKNIDAYDMPKEFAKLQGQDMGKVGAIQDLMRGIEKIIPPQKSQQQQKEKEEYSEYDKAALKHIKRGLLQLEDKCWDDAYDSFCEAHVDSDSDEVSSAAHIGMVCAKLGISSIEEFEKGYLTLPGRDDYDEFACAVETKAGYVMLSRKSWSAAQEFFNEALELNPEYALAYIGKMMASNKISNESDVADSFFGRNQDIREDKNYQKALRFADAALRKRLEGYAVSQLPDDTETEETLRQIQERIKPFHNLLVANGNNTFALTSYGTVYSTGENKHGQCNTSSWNQVKSIAVGSYHIAGLKADGSVVAVGAKSELINRGQCQTGGWSDIKQIAVSSSATIGLKTNGSFIVCGDAIKGKISSFDAAGVATGVAKNILGQVLIPKMANYKAAYLGPDDIYGLTSNKRVETINSYDACSNWHGIIDIATSPLANHVVGLSETGVCYARGENRYGECNVEDWEDIVAVAVGGDEYRPFTVGLRANGTVVAVGDNRCGQCRTSAWRNIVAIAAGEYHTVGLRADGTVIAVGGNVETNEDSEDKRNYGQCDTSAWKDIVAISAGAYHTVGLKADGTVVAVGSNEYGQCNTQDWREIGIIDPAREAKIAEERQKAVTALEKFRCKNAVAQRMLSVGDGYIVGLKSNGTVVATGDRMKKVSKWTDIVAVSAGYCDIVGLNTGGTVIDTGVSPKDKYNPYEHWKNIVAICDGIKGPTVGLTVSGTVKARGFSYSEFSDWKDIVAVSAGEFNIAGLNSSGKVVVAGTSAKKLRNILDWEDIVAVSVGRFHIVGLKSDGTVVVAADDAKRTKQWQDLVSDWKDIVAISTDKDSTVGLKLDGTVVAVGYYGKEHDVSGWRDLVAVCANKFCIVGLKSDGTVVATGSMMKEVTGWKLFHSIDTLRDEQKQAKEERYVALEKEKVALQTELANLKGLFSGKRRGEIEARLKCLSAEISVLEKQKISNA